MNESDRRDYVALEILKLIIVTFRGEDPESAAKTAYEYANEMIKARNQSNA
jgi:hypothetical protein